MRRKINKTFSFCSRKLVDWDVHICINQWYFLRKKIIGLSSCTLVKKCVSVQRKKKSADYCEIIPCSIDLMMFQLFFFSLHSWWWLSFWLGWKNFRFSDLENNLSHLLLNKKVFQQKSWLMFWKLVPFFISI